MGKQPTTHITTTGWYEHTDGTFGYYSWQGSGGVFFTALDIIVASWMDTFGPSVAELRNMWTQFLRDGNNQSASWCELALSGDDLAIRQCIMLNQVAA